MTTQSSAPARAQCRLELLVQYAKAPVAFPLPDSGVVTMGRSGCDIVIDDDSTSRRHAAIHIETDFILIEDLGSKNGVTLYDAAGPALGSETIGSTVLRGDAVRIEVGDRFMLGLLPMVLRLAEPTRAQGAGPSGGDKGALGRPEVVIEAPAMRALYKQAERLARTDISILILGETGAGKEELASSIHALSPRASKPFCIGDCTKLTDVFAESEIFGHEKGAYTGAVGRRPGLLELADGGTLFLDEIGDLPETTQKKLLRVLEGHPFRRLGGTTDLSVDVRFVAATNRDLERDAAEGLFRSDLFHRLNGVTLRVPPLRERVEDIEPLANRFVAIESQRQGLDAAPVISDEVLSIMKGYAFPGNVRQLKKWVACGVALCEEGVIKEQDIFEIAQIEGSPAPDLEPAPPSEPAPNDLDDQFHRARRKRMVAALEACRHNQTRACSMMGKSRRWFVKWMGVYGIARARTASSVGG